MFLLPTASRNYRRISKTVGLATTKSSRREGFGSPCQLRRMMARLLMWNLSRLKTKSRPLTGPLPDLYVRDLTRMVEELNGVYLSGIQVGDARRFAIPNPRFKDFPILYNPEIVEQYDLIPSEGEGCLSFPGMWVQVPRFKYITVKYRDGQWMEHTATFGSEDQNTNEGLLAKAIQHEIFHMEGIVTHERI